MTRSRKASASTASGSGAGAVVLLGPQRFAPTLGTVVASLGIRGKIATVTAGWQERETEDLELHEHLDGRSVNLRLHERAIAVFERDRELATAYRRRQDDLRTLQDFYKVRLAHAIAAVRELLEADPGLRLRELEVEDAIEAVRTL